MKGMISIKEAAAYLGVSEMSIRRWTNSGKLNCYRVGSKRERRFKIEDLQAFLHEDRGMVPLFNGTWQVPIDAHISHFYKAEDDCLERGITYIEEALSRGEIVLVLSPESRRKKIRQSLESRGAMVPVLEDQGILTLCEGKPTPEEQIRFVDSIIEKSTQFNGFSLLGDMVWTRPYNWDLHALFELEKSTNLQREGKRTLFFCQYDVQAFSRDEAFMAMQTHTHTIYHGKLNPSPYYDLAASWHPAS